MLRIPLSSLAVVALLAPLLAGCATEKFGGEARGVTAIELMPHSAVNIYAWDSCARIINKFPKPTIISVPVFYADAWHSFITIPRKHVEVTRCD